MELVGGDGAGRAVLSAPKGLDLASPAWSPDGTRLVADGTRLLGDAARESTRLYVVDAATGRAGALPGGEGLTDPSWSPDGATIAAVQSGKTIRIVTLPANGGTPRALTAGPYDAMPAWSPTARGSPSPARRRREAARSCRSSWSRRPTGPARESWRPRRTPPRGRPTAPRSPSPARRSATARRAPRSARPTASCTSSAPTAQASVA